MIYKFAITVGEIVGIRQLAGEDETRYVLCGVNVEVNAKNVLLVACDGRRLGVLRSDRLDHRELNDWNTVQPVSFIIPTELIDRIRKASILEEDYDTNEELVRCWRPHTEEYLCCEFDSEKNNVSFQFRGEFTLIGQCIEGNFPNWRLVIPSTDGVANAVIAINPRLLYGFRRMADLVWPHKEHPIALRFSSTDTGGMMPIEVRITTSTWFYGVLMNVKISEGEYPQRWDWLKNPEPKQEPQQEVTNAAAS